MPEQPRTLGAAEVEQLVEREYAYGFVTDIETERVPPGLSEDVIRLISEKKEEPQWLLDWRLKAYEIWQGMTEPDWAKVSYPKINYDEISYYAAPKSAAKDGPKSLDDIDPELRRTYEKLGIPLVEQQRLAGVAVDAVFDSVSVATTFKEKLAELGVIFCSFSEAVKEHPELVRKYLGTVVPHTDNFFATLNSAVFSDGSFVYVPKGVRCPMELSTYFRINASETGQFERTLIVADEGSYVSYLEGCTAPMRDENQLHAAVVELVALDDARIKYSTVQNWYPGDKNGVGGIYNFVTKRGKCAGVRSHISWTQVETGSAITWKYPSCILQGDDSIGEFYSVALTNEPPAGRHRHQDDPHRPEHPQHDHLEGDFGGSRAEHLPRPGESVLPAAANARNYSQCDSLLIGDRCGSAHGPLHRRSEQPGAQLEHEASTSRIGEDQLFYCRQRGIGEEEAVSLIVNGFARDVLSELPMEFAVEAQKLLGVSLEGAVG